MHPILFQFDLPSFLGSREITVLSYTFFNTLGIVLSFIYSSVFVLKNFKTTLNQKIILLNATLISGYLGAHFFKWISTPKQSINALFHSDEMLAKGSILYGVILFLLPTMFFLAKKFKIPPWKFLDIIAISFPIYIIFLRIGCFSAGCCYGIQTHSEFGVIFTNPKCPANPLGQPLHPTQLYSLVKALLIIILLLIIKRKQKFDGQLILLFLIFYGIGRSIIEIFRVQPVPYIIKDVLTQAQFTSIIVIVVALILYRKLRQKALDEITKVKGKS